MTTTKKQEAQRENLKRLRLQELLKSLKFPAGFQKINSSATKRKRAGEVDQ